MIDKHHIAHYGIAGVIVVAMGSLWATLPSPVHPTVYAWSNITKDEAIAFASHSGTIDVYCASDNCKKTARLIASTMDKKPERPLWIPEGITVGAKTQEDADKIKVAAETYLHVKVNDAVPNQPKSYIGFEASFGDESGK